MQVNRVRVVVQDRRRLVREGLAAALAAHPRISVVGTIARATELAPPISGCADAVLVGDHDDVIEPGYLEPVRTIRFEPDSAISAIVDQLLGESDSGAPRNPVPDASSQRLTAREVEVVEAIADGLSNRVIGRRLGITEKTVDNHKQRIYAKLGVQSQAHAVAVTLATGVLGGGRRTQAAGGP